MTNKWEPNSPEGALAESFSELAKQQMENAESQMEVEVQSSNLMEEQIEKLKEHPAV